ncbi:DNA mismatch repair protein [Rhodococcus sp. PvP104]|uniref:MutS-related protein n=1 Tax=Rhodococcus sp. PvP104 TaxID=2817911 RepID=UPI001AEB22A6|nr:DNA mismatch repair protein [Rhodococcus sp. PvP104]MBP2527292.1 DNA mismatch repair ATPase MutS [Rhodococcus sp. PvP104]
MKAHLMYRGRDFAAGPELPSHAADLRKDLELDTMLDAMADGDAFLRSVADSALLTTLTDPDDIIYRQQILRDCFAQPAVLTQMYQLAVEAIEREHQQYYPLLIHSPDPVLHRSIQVLEMFLDMLARLRNIGAEHSAEFTSEGFTTLFTTLARELDDDFFRSARDQLEQLHFPQGALLSATLGAGNKGESYVLHAPPHRRWWERFFAMQEPVSYSFEIADRDIAGAQALGDLKGRGVILVAHALAQSADHILSFFRMLRTELGFYIGALNLARHLAALDEPICFPEPTRPGETVFTGTGMYDVALSLTTDDRVVGNDIDADGNTLVMITGANQGGKSRFLRSVGLAQLMMQAGLFAPAHSMRATARAGVFTHFKREEDATMERGKLDEELHRMSRMIDLMPPNAMLLCNESFASTNEREGSHIASSILHGLLDTGTTVFFVTHMFHLADSFHTEAGDTTLFLRAERRPDGERTFRIIPGAPLPTSFGEDLYQRIFGVRLGDSYLI